MTDNAIDIEREKKINLRLSISIGAAGVLGFIIFYVLIFAVFIFSPFLMFGLFPFPTLIDDVVQAGGTVYVFTQKPDFNGATMSNPPDTKNYMQTYASGMLSEPVEVEGYSSAVGSEDGLYLLSKGGYRLFKDGEWSTHEYGGIGSSPRGAASPEGLWVLSCQNKDMTLKLLRDSGTEEVPLPDDSDDLSSCSTRMIWYAGALYIFWKDEGDLAMTRYKEGIWSDTEHVSEYVSKFGITERDGKLLLFVKDHRNSMWMSEFDGVEWTDWAELPIPSKMSFGFYPVVLDGKTVVITSGIFSSRYYFIEDGGVDGPYDMKGEGTSSFSSFMLAGAAFGFVPMLIFLAFVLIISAIVNKYKLRRWPADKGDFEFASLARRGFAKTIDYLLFIAPFTVPMLYMFDDRMFEMENPLEFFSTMAMMMLLMVFMVISSYLYHSLLEGIWGKTLGKKLLGIKVLKDDFTPCTLGPAFLRNLLRIVDQMFYYLVAIVSLAATLKWQRLGDLAAGTVVVRDRGQRD